MKKDKKITPAREVEQLAAEIIKRQKEERIKAATNPSAIALSSLSPNSGDSIQQVKKTVRQLFVLYLTNQFVSRAINVRADTLISKGYEILGDDKNGEKLCNELIDMSGGINLFWQLCVNTDIAGDGFLEKIFNKKRNKILRLKHVHPLTLRFKTDAVSGKIIVDASTKEPVGYVQVTEGKDGIEFGKDINKKIIEHLRFNTLGDEFTGISTLQSGYDTIVRLMNMEWAAAHAAVKSANPIIVGKCNTKSPHQIAQWGTILGRISGKEQVFVPQDMELEMLSPGKQNFSEYSEYFLNAVVASFGVPKSILLGASGSGGAKGDSIVLTRHFYSMIRSNQQYMETYFNNIFKEYAELAGFKAPVLKFEDVAEDAEVNADATIKLLTAGIIDVNEARIMIGLKKTKSKTLLSEVKDTDKKIWHPTEPGSPAGSQKGEKTKMKASPYSPVKK